MLFGVLIILDNKDNKCHYYNKKFQYCNSKKEIQTWPKRIKNNVNNNGNNGYILEPLNIILKSGDLYKFSRH